MLLQVLLIIQVVAMAGLIVIGGLVEGYGYGLSLDSYSHSQSGLAQTGCGECTQRSGHASA